MKYTAGKQTNKQAQKNDMIAYFLCRHVLICSKVKM